MPTSKSDLASRVSMVTGLSCSAAASTSALSWRSSPIAASYSPTAVRWAGVSPGTAFHLSAWFWNIVRSSAWSRCTRMIRATVASPSR